jgi:hypothetical protein
MILDANLKNLIALTAERQKEAFTTCKRNQEEPDNK